MGASRPPRRISTWASRPCRSTSHYDELLRASGLARYRVGLEIDGVQARLLATEAGLGIMGVFVPPYARRDVGGLLQPLRLQTPPPRAEFGLVSREPHLQTPAAREFADWLRRRTATPAAWS